MIINFNKQINSISEFKDFMIGNWKSFSNFYWSAKSSLNDPDNFCIVYIKTRDSKLIELANSLVISNEFDKDQYYDDVYLETHSHWAYGYIEGYAIRVINNNGEITEAFKKLYYFYSKLNNYSILNDDIYSEMELSETINNINDSLRFFDIDLNNNYNIASEVYEWLSLNIPNSLQSKNDFGGEPSYDDIKKALNKLNYI